MGTARHPVSPVATVPPMWAISWAHRESIASGGRTLERKGHSLNKQASSNDLASDGIDLECEIGRVRSWDIWVGRYVRSRRAFCPQKSPDHSCRYHGARASQQVSSLTLTVILSPPRKNVFAIVRTRSFCLLRLCSSILRRSRFLLQCDV